MRNFLIFLACALVAIFLVLAIFGGAQGALAFAMTADPLLILALAAGALALCSFVAGLLSGDYSWVDRLWSTAPVVFVWYYVVRSGFDLRLVLMGLAVAVWGGRLTFNFARKGGYSGAEDYRWPILRKQIPNAIAWGAFNFFFISFYQIGMFLLFTIPAYMVFKVPGLGLNPAFVIFLIVALGAVLIESLADRQQWDFHALKKDAANGKDVSDSPLSNDVGRGFLSSGLFSVSRHPNYFGELSFWWALFFAAAASTGNIVHWEILGPVLLTVLFIGSTVFTEGITGAKYPDYAAYRKRVSAIIPWFPARASVEPEAENGENVETKS